MVWNHSFLVMLLLWVVLDVAYEMMAVVVVQVIGNRSCRDGGCGSGFGFVGRGIVASVVVGRMH